MLETLIDCQRAERPQGCTGDPIGSVRPRLKQLTEVQIIGWADAHRDRTGGLPKATSGEVVEAPWETWSAINAALSRGHRGLPGGDSLARLLRRTGRIGERRGRPPQVNRQELARCLLAAGLSRAEIGRRLGVSRQAAWELLKRIVPEDVQEIGS